MKIGEILNHCYLRSLDQYILKHSIEVETYISDIKSGRSATVNSEYNDCDVFISAKLLLELMNLYLHKTIEEWDLEYIFNVLEISENFECPKIEQIIFNFANPYLNYNINNKNIELAIHFLTDKHGVLKLESNDYLRKDYNSIVNNVFDNEKK